MKCDGMLKSQEKSIKIDVIFFCAVFLRDSTREKNV